MDEITGDITINDLLLNMPYGNTIDVLELKGKHILDMLEHSVKRYEDSGNAGEFIQLSGKKQSFKSRLLVCLTERCFSLAQFHGSAYR